MVRHKKRYYFYSIADCFSRSYTRYRNYVNARFSIYSFCFLIFSSPCFIYLSNHTAETSIHIFLHPFRTSVWFSLIGVVILSTLVHYMVVRFESDRIAYSMKAFSDLFLLKIGVLCQQGNRIQRFFFS